MINSNEIMKPTLLVNKNQAIKNIQKITSKTKNSGVRFRPHFKTHQSAEIGEWFRKEGVQSITVSSIDMAIYFADHGWNDITVAFPVNIREIDKINSLASNIKLHLLAESTAGIDALEKQLDNEVGIWIEIDTGHHRTGIIWNKFEEIKTLASKIKKTEKLKFKGILTHSGHTYKAKGKEDILSIYRDSVNKMTKVKEFLQVHNYNNIEISVGDTPTASVVEDFSEVDEIRPGNFVFYDIMQYHIDACSIGEIAVGIVCPVVSKHADRNEIVIYGGAVHLSKDHLEISPGQKLFGYVSKFEENGWGSPLPNTYVSKLSQEHGIIQSTPDIVGQIKFGDLLVILPVHSCLAANLLRNFMTNE